MRIQYPMELMALAVSLVYPYDAMIDGPYAFRGDVEEKAQIVVTTWEMSRQFLNYMERRGCKYDS